MTSRDSKITFRVGDDLLDRVDEIDESRSEIMREALRSYLDGGAGARGSAEPAAARDLTRPRRPQGFGFDDLLTHRIEEVVDGVVERKLAERDVNVTLNVPEYSGQGDQSGSRAPRSAEPAPSVSTGENAGQEPVRQSDAPVETEGSKTCPQCGEDVNEEHVHCPNCGAKTSQRVFCDCGDEVRSDWSFCPSCGRRTPSSHALTGN